MDAAVTLSVISHDGAHVSGPPPTSEVPLHLAVYRATDAHAIAHVHAVASTAASCTCGVLPALHYNVVAARRRTAHRGVRPLRHRESSRRTWSSALAGGRSAALMQNHGSFAYGPTSTEACDRVELLEWLCELHLAAYRIASAASADTRDLDAVRTGRQTR